MGVVICSKRHVFTKLIEEANLGEIIVRHYHLSDGVFKVQIDNVEGRRLKDWEFQNGTTSGYWYAYVTRIVTEEVNNPNSNYLVPQHLMDVSLCEAQELAVFFTEFL